MINSAVDRTPKSDQSRRDHRLAAAWMVRGLKALLVFNLASLIVYNFLTYRLTFHSDSAVMNIFAEQVLRNRSFVPSDWVYVHGDIMVFFGHLFIVPLLPFFDNGFALHAIAGVAMAALLMGSLWWVTGLLSLSMPIRLLGACLVSSGISPSFVESYFGQAAYGSIAVLLLLHAGLAIVAFDAWQRCELKRHRATSVALAIVAFVSFLANPERAIVTYVVPLTAAIVTMLVLRKWNGTVRHREASQPSILLPACSYVIGALLGAVLHAHMLKAAVTAATQVQRSFVPLGALTEQLSRAVQSILYLFGATGQIGTSVVGIAGLSVALHLVLASSVIAAGLSLANGIPRASWQLLLAFNNAFLSLLLATAFLYVFTDLGGNVATSRYFVPAFTLGFISLLWAIDENVGRRRPGFWALVVLASVLGVSLSASYQISYAPLYTYIRANGYALQLPRGPSEGLIAFLEKNGLTYGYASFWNSHVNTVLSGGKVTIRPVAFATLPRAMYHLSAPSWYWPSSHAGPVFLLVSASDAKGFDANEMERAVGAPKKVLTYGGFKIYVYAHNFGVSILGWDPEVRNPSTMRYSSETPHRIGRYVDNGSKPGWMESAAGQSGALVFGPYISLLKGKYVADFEVSGCSSGQKPSGHVDISARIDGQRIQLGKLDIRPDQDWAHGTVPFALRNDTPGVEFRVFSSGADCLRARSVTIRRDE